jgi:hypothetical protein
MAPRTEASLLRALVDHIIVALDKSPLYESFPSGDQLDEMIRGSAW